MSKSITKMLEEIEEQICNNYCKHLERYNADPEKEYDDNEFNKFTKEYCENCPLQKI